MATTVHIQYVWSPRYIDSPVLRDRDTTTGGDLGGSGSGLDERLYYLTDANANVTAVVNTSGEAVERYAYDPYGEVQILNGASGVDADVSGGVTEWDADGDGVSDVANEILYCGYRYDPETGFYHVRNRMYHPRLGAWLQRDPLGYVDGLNLYEYCGSGPINGIDPMGLIDPSEDPIARLGYWLFAKGKEEEFLQRTDGRLNQVQFLMDDVISWVPVVGDVSEGISGGIWVIRGCKGNAFWNLSGFMIPGGGGSSSRKRLAREVVEFAGDSFREGAERSIRRNADDVVDSVLDSTRRNLDDAADKAGDAARRNADNAADKAGDAARRNADNAPKGGGRVNKVQPVEGAGPHTAFKRDPQTGKITGYTEYDGAGNPVKRYRGEGGPHGGVEPPIIYERKPGKNPPSPLNRARPARPDEIPGDS